MVNTLGVSLSILPFVMMYVQEIHDGQTNRVGQFLLLKVSAAVLSGFLLFSFSKKVGYSQLMYLTASIGLGILMLILGDFLVEWFEILFVLGGVLITAYKISIDGVLMEVSSDQNRSIYAGIVGIGNIIPAFFPIVGGVVVHLFGFTSLFVTISILLLLSYYFIYKLDCQK